MSELRTVPRPQWTALDHARSGALLAGRHAVVEAGLVQQCPQCRDRYGEGPGAVLLRRIHDADDPARLVVHRASGRAWLGSGVGDDDLPRIGVERVGVVPEDGPGTRRQPPTAGVADDLHGLGSRYDVPVRHQYVLGDGEPTTGAHATAANVANPYGNAFGGAEPVR